MTTLTKMKEFLTTRYPNGDCADGDIQQKICELQCSELLTMDHNLDLIDEADFYGVNFTNNQQVYMLFFIGSSDYFPGIWIGNDDIEHLDSMPIYL